MKTVIGEQDVRHPGLEMSQGGVSLVGRLMAIVCVAILAHLILMTSAVDAEGHHAVSQNLRGHVVGQLHIATPIDASPCYTTRFWVEPTRFTLHTQLQTTFLTIHPFGSLPTDRSRLITPSRPPGVTRALLQVYRI